MAALPRAGLLEDKVFTLKDPFVQPSQPLISYSVRVSPWGKSSTGCSNLSSNPSPHLRLTRKRRTPSRTVGVGRSDIENIGDWIGLAPALGSWSKSNFGRQAETRTKHALCGRNIPDLVDEYLAVLVYVVARRQENANLLFDALANVVQRR